MSECVYVCVRACVCVCVCVCVSECVSECVGVLPDISIQNVLLLEAVQYEVVGLLSLIKQ